MIYVLIPYIAAFLLVVFEMRGLLGTRALRVPALPAWCWVGVLILSYALQLADLRYGATHETPMQSWRAAMPIPVLYRGIDHVDAVAAIFLALAAVQSLALVAIYRASIARVELVLGTAILLAMSLAAPVLGSFDVYVYVRDALLGHAGYVPATVPFVGEYHVFDLWFDTRPVMYGPLWTPIAQLMTGAGSTLLGKLLAYRVCSAFVFLALLVLMRSLGLPVRLLAVTALNPALAWQFVANAHNDIIAIAIIVAAAVMIRRNVFAAFGLIVVAGMVKLPYVVLALPIVSSVRPAARRYAGCAIAIAATALFTWWGGGVAYLRDLSGFSSVIDQDLIHAVPFAAALAAIVAAILGLRRLRTAVWLMPVFGAFRLPLIFPWYVAFGFPYALARHNALRYLLVSFPFVTAILTPELMRAWTLLAVIPFAVVLSLRRPQLEPASPTTEP
jgi:hypothetical protein